MARIPAHSPDWTDFNATDPGITLVQLSALLAESLLHPHGKPSPDEKAIRRRITETMKRQRPHGRVVVAGSDKRARAGVVRFVAAKLGLDLYRIDLSACRSRYLDETEKNLRPIFDAAEATGAILFFDEADALFGKRSDVKDSHDRFTELEANELLQRLETFDGIAVLAVKESESIDAAKLCHKKWLVYRSP
ncbi:MAG TPA: AAA family ATPase [Chthoniobacterales bacterium]